MAFQPAINCAQIAVQCLYSGQQVENLFYVQKSGPWVEGDLQAIADAVDSWASGHLMPVCNASAQYVRTVVRDLTEAGAPEAMSSVHGGTAGTTPGAQLPGNVAFAIHRDSVVTGKHSKSRVYVFGLVAEEQSTPGVLRSDTANIFK